MLLHSDFRATSTNISPPIPKHPPSPNSPVYGVTIAFLSSTISSLPLDLCTPPAQAIMPRSFSPILHLFESMERPFAAHGYMEHELESQQCMSAMHSSLHAARTGHYAVIMPRLCTSISSYPSPLHCVPRLMIAWMNSKVNGVCLSPFSTCLNFHP
jgi:hypothetical protein